MRPAVLTAAALLGGWAHASNATAQAPTGLADAAFDVEQVVVTAARSNSVWPRPPPASAVIERARSTGARRWWSPTRSRSVPAWR
jgi:hypothetical protein